MSDEGDLIKITFDDIDGANQLSLACPICAGAVNRYENELELHPVVCTDCATLYHRLCWQRNGGRCAVLGCNSTKARAYGQAEVEQQSSMILLPSDIPTRAPSTPLKRRSGSRVAQSPAVVESERERGVFGRFIGSFLRALGFRQ